MQARQRCVTDLFTSEMHKFLMWDALLGGQLARGTGAEKYFPFWMHFFLSRSLMWCRGNSLGPDPPCNGRFHCGAIAAWFYRDGVQYVMRACSEGTSGNALVQNCTEYRYSRTIAPFEQ